MVLKFGRLVDLEELEQVTVNRQVEELKEKLRLTEIECSEDLKRYDVSICVGYYYIICVYVWGTATLYV